MLSKIKQIKKIDSQDRYDLSVKKNHNYFANNILVHNCRANLYFQNNEVKSQSRKGKPFKVIDHITKSLHTFLSANKTLVLDGELFTRKLNFQEIISAIKRDE